MNKIKGFFIVFFFACAAQAATYPLPNDGSLIVGQPQQAKAKKGDTLNRLAVRYGVGYNEMVRANPRWKGRKIPSGTTVIIPTQHRLPNTTQQGIVINLADMRLFYYPPGQDTVVTFPIAIGKRGWRTPKGQTSVIGKRRNPTWTPPASIRREAAKRGKKLKKVYRASPSNPLGTRALRLGLPGYLIHGTNKPYSIGKRISHGCIRLRRSDIEHLFDLVAVDTPVTIVSQASRLPYSPTESPENYEPAPIVAKKHHKPRRKPKQRKTTPTRKVRRRPVDEPTPIVSANNEFNMRQLQQEIDSGAVTPINLSDL